MFTGNKNPKQKTEAKPRFFAEGFFPVNTRAKLIFYLNFSVKNDFYLHLTSG